jgi:alkanesulfonate monooxygenase SsuD/methylene tetrahydromethanopterin reductase-like flavin-dependent oxidoreductase (luciferase family)
MKQTRRGIGVAGALDHGIVSEIIFEIEQRGYSSFWANDTPGGDGLASLAIAAPMTTSLQLGVGVIAVDRVPAEVILERIEALHLPVHRLTVGIGSGGARKGALDLVREAARTLRAAGVKVVVGALGPKMIELGGSETDGVLLNWLTPVAAERSVDDLRVAANGKAVAAIAYVRVALANGALAKLESEALRYESYPQYAAHFERMGVRAIDTCVSGPTAAAIQAGLAGFNEIVDEIVVRAIVAEENATSYLDLIRAAAPEV